MSGTATHVAGMPIAEYMKLPRNVENRKRWAAGNPEKAKQYQITYRRKNPELALLKAAKHRAKKKELNFNLEVTDIVIPKLCPILGIEIVPNDGENGNGGRMNSPSLDRIDNSLGYVKGNVQVISHMANSMKFTANKEQLLNFAKWVLKTYE